MLKSIRILLSITIYFYYKIWKMNVKTILINDYLDEGIYITHLEGLKAKGLEHLVCEWHKLIYRLNIHVIEQVF